MVSTRPPTSMSSSPFSNPLVTVPNAPITIGIIVTFMSHSFSNSLASSRNLSFFSYSFNFILWSAETAKSTILEVLFFLLIIIRSGLLAEIKWYVCTSKFHRSWCVSFSRTGAIIIIIITISPCEFFTTANADGILLVFEQQQVFTSLQDSSQYSGRSHWCSSLDGLHSSYFQVLRSLY